jgi:hypothetical protein
MRFSARFLMGCGTMQREVSTLKTECHVPLKRWYSQYRSHNVKTRSLENLRSGIDVFCNNVHKYIGSLFYLSNIPATSRR